MSVPGQTANPEESEPGTIHTSGNGSGFTTAEESPFLAIERSGSSGNRGSKATGPRTELGKQRASHNATKHGVFSKVVVLPDESRAEYERLFAGLRESLRPEGALEELLVEKLAATVWRQRRLLLSEGAEIRKGTEFVESDQQDFESEEAEEFGRRFDPFNKIGLIQKIHNPDVLERCLELLSELQGEIEKNGFNREHDTDILERIHGDRDEPRLREDLYDFYKVWLDTLEAPEEERVREGYASPEQCRENIMQEIKWEIRGLKRHQKAQNSIEAARTELEVLRRSVPDSPGIDRLIRYEASLERSFERTLNQLERLQRTRLGQSVLPKLEVHHSLS